MKRMFIALIVAALFFTGVQAGSPQQHRDELNALKGTYLTPSSQVTNEDQLLIDVPERNQHNDQLDGCEWRWVYDYWVYRDGSRIYYITIRVVCEW